MNKNNQKLNLFVQSLGCPKNTVDTELMLGFLEKTGNVSLTNNAEDSDVMLINTCGFITPAIEESLDAIMEAVQIKKRFKNKKIVVAGCLYERYKEELKQQIPEVDSFVGVYELESVVKKILHKDAVFDEGYKLRKLLTPNHIGYLKIAEGCSNGCSFCAIPLIKGGFKDKPMDEIIREAQSLSAKGVKELYIIAQDTTAYMLHNNKKNRLVELLRQIEKIDGIEWIRIMYTYPPHIDDELIDFIADSKKVLNYIDVPFQHISSKILQDMNRGYDRQTVEDLVKKLKSKNITIRSTFIVGFPTETEDDFEELKTFIKKSKIDWVGFFKYYHEENTKSYNLKDLDDDIKSERLAEIELLQKNIYNNINKQFIGKRIKVIIDKESDEMPGYFEARSYRNAFEIDGLIFVKSNKLSIGKFAEVKIIDIVNDTDLMSEEIET